MSQSRVRSCKAMLKLSASCVCLAIIWMVITFVIHGCSSSSSGGSIIIDTTFGTSGKVLTSVNSAHVKGNAMIIQPDNRIIVTGGKGTDAEGSFLLARYNADGTLDATFGVGGIATTPIGGIDDSANAVVLQRDGKIIIAGYAWNGSDYRFALARYTSSGILDPSFGTGGTVLTSGKDGVDELAFAAALQTDGKIVVVGYSGSDTNSFALARYTSDGSLDTTFGVGGKVTTSVASDPVDDLAYAVKILSDGKILVSGMSYEGKYKFAVVRYTTAGAVDTTFGVNGIVTTAVGSDGSGAYGLAVNGNGEIFATGYANNSESDSFALVKYTSDGNLDTSFGNAGMVVKDFGGSGALDYAILLKTDGKILIAGYNDNYERESETPTNLYFAMACYNPDGSPDTSFAPEGAITTPVGDNVAFATAIGIQQNGRIILGGCATEGLQNKIALVRYIF